MIESASVVCDAFANALRGTAFAAVDVVVVFGVLPEIVPALCDVDPLALVRGSALEGGVRTVEEGVYFTDVVNAFDPAAAEADAENDVAAPAPLPPDEAFD